MLRRCTAITALVFLAATTPAAARPPGPGAPGPGGPGPGDGRHLRALAAFLELTPEQVESATALAEELRAAAEPLHGELADLQAELHDLLTAADPDAGAVGQAVLEIDRVREQLAGLRADFETGFEALLTPEQLERYEAFRAARGFRCHRRGQGGPRFGGGVPGGGPGGLGGGRR